MPVRLNLLSSQNDLADYDPVQRIESVDLQILKALQKDPRSSFRDIARKLGIAVGTVQSRFTKLRESKVIRGFSVDLDYSKIGLHLTSVILLKVKGKYLREVETKLSRLSNVCVVYDITGDFDVAVVAKFSGASAMDHFIKKILSIDYVESSVTSIVLNSVKEDYGIPL
jgi:DNA-binding Lrp family transcriptional regulator